MIERKKNIRLVLFFFRIKIIPEFATEICNWRRMIARRYQVSDCNGKNDEHVLCQLLQTFSCIFQQRMKKHIIRQTGLHNHKANFDDVGKNVKSGWQTQISIQTYWMANIFVFVCSTNFFTEAMHIFRIFCLALCTTATKKSHYNLQHS